MAHLTKPEQETVVTFDAEGGPATVYTAMRRIITKLRKNPNAKELESGFIGSTEWAKFEMPQRNISFRTGRIIHGDAEGDEGEAPAPPVGVLECPAPGCDKTFASKQGRKNHILKNHPDQEVPA